MLTAEVFHSRRQRLSESVGRPILLCGSGNRARNLPMNILPFRQDSTFLYFTGCSIPDAAAYVLGSTCVLFLPSPADDDPLWHGEVPNHAEQRTIFGVDKVEPLSKLPEYLGAKDIATLAVPDEQRNQWLQERIGIPLRFGMEHGDSALVDAVIQMRLTKGPLEIAEMRIAAGHSAVAHTAVMKAVKPGVHERQLAALFEAVLAARGCTTGYGTILTARGEILHNFHHINTLKDGDLLLIDGGGEVASGYGVDITRTFPVSGQYDARQKDVYQMVLEAQQQSIDMCRPGVQFRQVHDQSCRVIAQFLLDENLVNGTVDSVLATGAHALFFPHGVGHHLGLDVHDMENFGDLPSYPKGTNRSEQFGTCYLRMDLPLQKDWIVTIEPGFYIIPAMLDSSNFRKTFAGVVNFDKAEQWRGFGGIRIEDDILITENGCENLTIATPKAVEAIEPLLGQGVDLQELLF